MTIALLLDIDGTLVEFADHPDAVSIDPGLVELLDGLERSLDGALALVSGRSIATIDRLFAPRQYAAAGLHGIEIRAAPWQAIEIREDTSLPVLVRDAIQVIAPGYPGIMIEDKVRTVALHYPADFTERAALERLLESVLQKHAPGWIVQAGRRLLELRPANVDKGLACERLMASQPFAGRYPVIVGDDITDLHAFAYVRRAGGLAVSVDERIAHAADLRLDTPADARAWLVELYERLLDDPALGVETVRIMSAKVQGPSPTR